MCRFLMLLFVLFTIATGSAQNDTIASTENKESREYVRLCVILPGALGDNFLADANQGTFGLGLAVSLPIVYNFYLGAGLELMSYKVTDKAMAGNASATNLSIVYGELFYKIPLLEDLSINPRIAVGSFKMRQKTGRKDYGLQTGTVYTVGFNVDYKLLSWLKGFAGVNYSLLKGKTKTNAEYMSYFNDIQQLNIIIGFKF